MLLLPLLMAGTLLNQEPPAIVQVPAMCHMTVNGSPRWERECVFTSMFSDRGYIITFSVNGDKMDLFGVDGASGTVVINRASIRGNRGPVTGTCRVVTDRSFTCDITLPSDGTRMSMRAVFTGPAQSYRVE